MTPAPRPRRYQAVIAGMLFAAGALRPHIGVAEGALAVGLPKDVTAEGFAYSFALDKPTAADATAEALADCKTPSQGVDQRAQALCAVVQTFHDQCFAVAMDPKDATPGVGWAVAADKAAASRDAIAKCVTTAGDDRRQFCQVIHADCDGAAK